MWAWWNWLTTSSAATVVVLLVLTVLKQSFISGVTTTVEKSVEARFNEKLERLRSELKRSESQFQAQLQAKQAEIDAIRTGALSGLINRQALLNQKRIEAVEKVWGTIIELRKLLPIASTMAAIKFAEAADGTKSDPKLRQVFEQIFKAFGVQQPDFQKPAFLQATLVKPFIPDDAWQYFAAYQSILMHSYIQMSAISTGVGSKVVNSQPVLDQLKKSLPYLTGYLEQNGTSGLYYLLPQIEEMVFLSLRQSLDGRVADKEALTAAGELIRQSTELEYLNVEMSQRDLIAGIPEDLRTEKPSGRT